MDEIIEETYEQEIDEIPEEDDFESTNVAKWVWIVIGAAAAASVGGVVMFVKNKLFCKKVIEVSEEEDIEIVEEFEEDESKED